MPVAPAYRPVPPRIVPVMWFCAAVPSPCEFAEHLVAALVRPDAAAHEPRGAVDERDHLGAESDAGAPRAREQHRPSQVDDRAPAIRAEGNGPAAAGGVPGALELQPLAGGRRLRRLRRRTAGGRGQGQGHQDGSPPRAPRRRRLRDPLVSVPETDAHDRAAAPAGESPRFLPTMIALPVTPWESPDSAGGFPKCIYCDNTMAK